MALLEANGSKSHPIILRKRVRDEVSYGQGGSSKPWRRSPFWLTLRVAIQRHLYLTLGGEIGRMHYKFLMCSVMLRFLEDALPHLHLECSILLKKKLCRRLFKLEQDRDQGTSGEVTSEYDSLFENLGKDFSMRLTRATATISLAWEKFRHGVQRPMHSLLLPFNADHRHLHLALPSSKLYLDHVLDLEQYRNHRSAPAISNNLLGDYLKSNKTAKASASFALRYFDLTEEEESIERECRQCLVEPTHSNCADRCEFLAKRIDSYLNAINHAYDNNPEQKSIMLLSIMELWVEVDSHACKTYEPLRKYIPLFPPSVMDLLQVARYKDLVRVRNIRAYLEERNSKCTGNSMSIFHDPANGCFAEAFYNHPIHGAELRKLHAQIEEQAQLEREEKKKEWQQLSNKYENLVTEFSNASCLFYLDEDEVKTHDDEGCRKCFLRRSLRRLKIECHEYPLPSSSPHSKAVLLEICCPSVFARYREVTWRIFTSLAYNGPIEKASPELRISEYSELKTYKSRVAQNFSLASLTKSFLQTHYREVKFPVSLDNIFLSNPLDLRYHDNRLKVFSSALLKQLNITFGHHCSLALNSKSPFSSLLFLPEFAVESQGPSSYEIVASQTKCPAGLSVHEYLSFQSLFSGKSRRWVQILAELGSSNVNFSSEAVTNLLNLLALQVGPGDQRSPLGIVHRVFREKSFCSRLLEQLQLRLDAVAANWRETNVMETLITLAFRILELGFPTSQACAVRFLKDVRVITLKWASAILKEIHENFLDPESYQRYSRYALLAALLCRRTFAMYLDGKRELESEAVTIFVQSSVHLQNTLIDHPSEMTPFLKTAYIRDLKYAYKLRAVLQEAIQKDQNALFSAIRKIWPDIEGAPPRIFSELKFLPAPEQWWVQTEVGATAHAGPQVLHLNILKGDFLVGGMPMGMLPPDFSKSKVFEQLFGKQNLLTWPSSLPGMSYMVASDMHGHQIHLGFRGEILIIRALWQNTCLEFIPVEIFGTGAKLDLPFNLSRNCVHWLDLATGIVDIRQRTSMWRVSPRNWRLDVRARRATKNLYNLPSTLVDPHSVLFERIARIFEHFEERYEITVFQPHTGRLTVELRRLGLTFFVNSNHLLESQEMRAQIDINQDAGTWHGLLSKLVLREVIQKRNPKTKCLNSIPRSQRFILVPIGEISYMLRGPHVVTRSINDGGFGKFVINEVLGRLECATEPRLLYLKEMYHAYTSFALPDELTGRTGTEEALHILKSGISSGTELTPTRVYYPPQFLVLQKSSWNPKLTMSIQHDDFHFAVAEIRRKSLQLCQFSLAKIELPELAPIGDSYLNKRSSFRRSIFERQDSCPTERQALADKVHQPRTQPEASKSRLHVLETTELLRAWPSKISTTDKLASTLQGWLSVNAFMGGYSGLFSKVLQTTLLESDLARDWGSLVNMCRMSGPDEAYPLMFSFALLSFPEDANMEILRTLIAFATFPDLKEVIPPKWKSYRGLQHENVPSARSLVVLMVSCELPYELNSKALLGPDLNLRPCKGTERDAREYRLEQHNEKRRLAEYLVRQWPCPEPSTNGFPSSQLIDLDEALANTRPEWMQCFQTFQHGQFISKVQSILNQHQAISNPEKSEQLPRREPKRYLPNTFFKQLPRISDLTRNVVSTTTGTDAELILRSILPISKTTYPLPARTAATRSQEIEELKYIVKKFSSSTSLVQQEYCRDLSRSIDAQNNTAHNPMQKPLRLLSSEIVMLEAQDASHIVKSNLEEVRKSLQHLESYKWLALGGLLPAVTPITVLETLRSSNSPSFKFGGNIKNCILKYAISITNLQRLLRIQEFFMNRNKNRLAEEQRNSGHGNWKPQERPDWLLLEIESNILIRDGQVDVALATINPESKANSVLQMNMGQGKTSCIMPMVAAVLADGESLFRVVVPRALLQQTAQLLHSRLGGLLGRELRHVPFSRRTPTNSRIIKTFFDIHQGIRKSSGIIIALPEHQLSFKLSGLQRLCDNKIPEAVTMINVQSWMNNKSRDVLDECDNILALRTQLIYPSGSQKTVDGHPHRWEISEALLSRVDGHLYHLEERYPRSIEVIRRKSGGFPIVYFLQKDVEDELITLLVDDVFHGRTTIFPQCSLSDRLAIKSYISEAKPSSKVVERINKMFPENLGFRQAAHLIRGLFVFRIFLMALKKRWNVQYGLHPKRDPMAVPYHAKGTPSEQAEWGHPDVAILLTCLSFYYDGLRFEHLEHALEHILKSDDPSQIYSRLSQTSGLPDSLQEWTSINIEDAAQVTEIWNYLRYNVIIIDYYLNNFVFSRHAKQFQLKLQASGWDIPLWNIDETMDLGSAPPAKNLTTGFSGTNDWKGMLPLTIEQRDLASLAHTNAEVLTYLLQPRNRRYLFAHENGRRLSEDSLLRMIFQQNIRVLIDAGAQILEMDNETLVRVWLEIDHAAPAAVYFDSSNKPCVYIRKRRGSLPLLASPYAEDLSSCLVYLDEAHTRGTDLKLPPNAVGALTLGLGQTKDHTVQAAMRLRQLGTTQSVVFVAPPEVHQSILDVQSKNHTHRLNSHDVICWLLHETCRGIEQLQPLYFAQGADFCRRTQAAFDCPKAKEDYHDRSGYLKCVMHIEQQTLEQLYAPLQKSSSIPKSGNLVKALQKFMKELNSRRKCFHDDGSAVHGTALQEVEQEREVAYEIEDVREVQKQINFPARKFPGLHQDIIYFTQTGRLVNESRAYHNAFTAIRKTVLGKKHCVTIEHTSHRLFVSAEFTKTVIIPAGLSGDHFQRPINWILWSPVTQAAMIVIPEEVELILPMMYQQPCHTHLMTYAAPVTRKMVHFNNLQFHSVPALPSDWEPPMWLRIELGIIAGRLYFEFNEYSHILAYLDVKEERGQIKEDDVLNDISREEKVQEKKSFAPKPLAFLQDWLALRRKGQDFSQTPVGFICQGKPLFKTHPFFSRPEKTEIKAQIPVIKSNLTNPLNQHDGNEEDVDVGEGFCEETVYGNSNEVDEFDDAELDETIWGEEDDDGESDES